MVEVDICIKIPASLPLAIVGQELMLTGGVYIGLRLSTINPITQVAVIDCRFYQFILVLLTKVS